VQAALNPQIEEARRQAQISRLADAGRLTQAGAYGGSRQAIMESELNRNLGQNVAAITGQGYQDAYTQAMNQFNVEQGRQQTAQDASQSVLVWKPWHHKLILVHKNVPSNKRVYLRIWLSLKKNATSRTNKCSINSRCSKDYLLAHSSIATNNPVH
jgi:hypothetical protein